MKEDNSKEILEIIKNTGALMKGHFILSSGKHTDTYIQLCKLFQKEHLSHFTKLCSMLSDKIKNNLKTEIDAILAPAMGAIVIGYEVAKNLQKDYAFCERVDNTFHLRRGFSVKRSNVLIVENVITTGRSALEAAECAKNNGANIVGFSSLIDRSINNPFQSTFISLCKINANEYQSYEDLPESMKETKPIKPGSRQ